MPICSWRRQLAKYADFGGVFTRQKSLQKMHMDLRLTARKTAMRGQIVNAIENGYSQRPMAGALSAMRALNYACAETQKQQAQDGSNGLAGVVLRRAEVSHQAAIHSIKKKKPTRMSAVVLMSVMTSKNDSRKPSQPPVWLLTNEVFLMTKEVKMAMLESARRTMHAIEKAGGGTVDIQIHRRRKSFQLDQLVALVS